MDEHFKNCVFLIKIWNLSQTGVIITKTWNSKIRITARISSLALIFFVLVDCVLRLRESKLSNSFRIFLGSKWTWFANFERKTPHKLRLLVFMHFIAVLGNQIRYSIRSSVSDLIWSSQIRSDEVLNPVIWWLSDEIGHVSFSHSQTYFYCVLVYVSFDTSHEQTLVKCV